MTNKKYDIVFEQMPDKFTIRIWADSGMSEFISLVEGVMFADEPNVECYKVIIDHRYDVKLVLRKIQETIKRYSLEDACRVKHYTYEPI